MDVDEVRAFMILVRGASRHNRQHVVEMYPTAGDGRSIVLIWLVIFFEPYHTMRMVFSLGGVVQPVGPEAPVNSSSMFEVYDDLMASIIVGHAGAKYACVCTQGSRGSEVS